MNEPFTRAATAAHIDLAHEPDFALGRLRVRPSLREIVCDGRHETIDRRVMQVLVVLARADGGVVSRDDLIASCWESVVVGEDAITNCIVRLRKAAEATNNAFAIETVPRVGYRLKVAEVAVVAVLEPQAQTAAPVAIAASPPIPTPEKSKWTPRTNWIAAFLVLAILAVIAAVFAFWRYWPKAAQIAAAPVEASVAVLPFVNMSGDPKQEYFSDGFSEELVNDLSNEPHLRVASRTSSFAFKGRNQDIETIARALRVRALVEGSIREAGDHVRITAQLIDASGGYHLWSATYDRDITDILSVQDELARAIASALTRRLVPLPARPRPKIDPVAYRLFLEGMRQFDLGPPEGWRNAAKIFGRVTAKAPDFADGFAWLARSADDLAVNYDPVPASDYALASDAAQRALSLAPQNILARTIRALVELQAWNWRGAMSDFRVIRHQSPNNFFLLGGLRNYYDDLGFPEQGYAVWQRLFATDPKVYRSSFFTIGPLMDTGRFQEAIILIRSQLFHREPDAQRLYDLCYAYAATSQIAEASTIGSQLKKLQTDVDSRMLFENCEWSIDISTGNRADAMRLLHNWESQFPDNFGDAAAIGSDYVLLGDFDKATDWLERAYERRESGSAFTNGFFESFYSTGLGYENAFKKYRATAGYKMLAAKPLFKEWQAEHDRIAAALAAHRDPLSLP